MAASIGIPRSGGKRAVRLRSTLLSGALVPSFCLALAVLPGCSRGEQAGSVSRPSILLLTVDGLRADRTGYSGHAQSSTPAIDALAARSVVFSSVQAPAPMATPSLASLHTGLYPMRHGVRVDDRDALARDASTLAEALSQAGYRTAALAGTLQLHPRHGLGRGFADYENAFAELPRPRQNPIMGFTPSRQVARAMEWLEGARNDSFFLWVNFFVPPELPLPAPFSEDFAGRLYEGRVAWVDREIGRLLDWVRDNDLDGRTIVVLAGSRGEPLGDHGEDHGGTLLYQSTLSVPLVIKPAGAPGGEPGGAPAGGGAAAAVGKRVDTPASLVDLMPTLLEAAGLSVPAGLDGRSLAAALSAAADAAAGPPGAGLDPDRPILSETMQPLEMFGWRPFAAVRSGRWKYIASEPARLFDLQADPAEAVDVAAANAEVAARLAREASRVTFELPGCAECPALARQLGLPWPGEVGPMGRPVDAESRLDVADDTLQAHRALQRKQPQAAMLLYESVLPRDPDNRLALVETGWLRGLGKGPGQLGPAMDLLRKAQRLYAWEAEPYHLMGHMAMVEDASAQARATALFKLAGMLEPLNEETLYDAACGVAVAGGKEEAFDLLGRSIAAGFRDYPHMRRDPDLASLRDDPRFSHFVPPAPPRPARPGPRPPGTDAEPGSGGAYGQSVAPPPPPPGR